MTEGELPIPTPDQIRDAVGDSVAREEDHRGNGPAEQQRRAGAPRLVASHAFW
jgi:hypothetical protein